MSTPEAKVKEHLRKRVKALGGDVRFIKYIGRKDCPDCLVMLPPGTPVMSPKSGMTWPHYGPVLVETKGSEDDARDSQKREHERLRAFGITVLVLKSNDEIDQAFPETK